jgi:hypothetical protein
MYGRYMDRVLQVSQLVFLANSQGRHTAGPARGTVRQPALLVAGTAAMARTAHTCAAKQVVECSPSYVSLLLLLCRSASS